MAATATKKAVSKKSSTVKGEKVPSMQKKAYRQLLEQLVASNAKGGAKCSKSMALRRKLRRTANWQARNPFPGKVELRNMVSTPKGKGKKRTTKKSA